MASTPHLLGRDELVTTDDGRRLRVRVGGDGEDLVVLEAGLGVSGLYWGPVHEALRRHVRVVAYDRAGFGASDPDTRPRDLTRLADDLEAVVRAHPHRRLVLVGHSWGGPIVRTVAARLVERGHSLAGVVLVDQSDENDPIYFTRLARVVDVWQASSMVPLARMRLLGPLTRASMTGLDVPLRRAVADASSSISAARETAAELAQVESGLERLKNAPPRLGSLPVTVISGQRATPIDRRIRRGLVRAHRTTAAQHDGGRFVPAERSAHLIPLTEPELIAVEAQRALA
ncbi:alpha/beta hydrolase [Microbacterium betulae]|uniref:Alpha/beta hydrolase n=1 Tax=Microbacterium betulae TaxID=2981139 RepID=A0AA97FHU1_9MICO|nr:alpha/beta hydrolase [Microbacterium sp. AB]WOF23501.1 alpha/beta hydrolase [Microbacterium sp. AB]